MMASPIVARRAAQISDYLKTMGDRVKTAGLSFIIFCEVPPRNERIDSVSPGLETVGPDDTPPVASRLERKYGRDRFSYYAQFCFDDDDFRIDLPNETLHPDEAGRLLSERAGFFWLRDVNGDAHPDTREFNPLQKVYAYGQERQAANDMLFLLLEVWNIPADFCWYVKAAPFDGGESWEWGEPLA